MRALVVVALVAGCSGPSPEGATPAPRASSLGKTLQAAGLRLDTLPASLDQLSAAQLDAVMHSFNDALGIDCNGCHAANDATATERVHIAARMWSDFVVSRRFADGRALYCDSCHQGRATFLQTDDSHALGLWMERYFADGLVRMDRRPNDCFSCHGTPFDPQFLDTWSAGP